MSKAAPKKPGGQPRTTLTAKQEQFCHEYIIDLNATQAAIRAGYSPKVAKPEGCRNLSRPLIMELLGKLKGNRAQRNQIDADYVLQRLAAIDAMDVGDIMDGQGNVLPINEWPDVWRKTLSGIEVSEIFAGSGDERVAAGVLKKIRWPDKLRNLELMGKHVNVGAFKESIDHVHSGEIRSVTRSIVDVARGK